MGAQQNGGTVTSYHDHPVTIAGGGSFALDSAGSQSAGMSI